jgi:hypothetical protein
VTKILIFSFFGMVGYAVGYGGQFGLAFLRKGSRYHRVLGRINLVLHIAVVLIALVLPPLTRFTGMPVLAYLSAALVMGSLFLYPLNPLSLRVRLFPAEGKRAKTFAERERSRWPYVWTCGTGYVVMLGYIWTIFPTGSA